MQDFAKKRVFVTSLFLLKMILLTITCSQFPRVDAEVKDQGKMYANQATCVANKEIKHYQ